MREHALQTSFGSFGAPPDAVALGALVLGLVLLGVGYEWRKRAASQSPPGSRPGVESPARAGLSLVTQLSPLSPRQRWYLAAIAMGAALLSWGYIAFYLRGGPRIIDATSYWLESRAIASGQWSIAVPSPTASFSGRFLLPSPDGAHLSPIFPPGYPTTLALFQRLGAPLVLGPLLASALVLTSFGCCHQLFPHSRSAPWFAAIFATFSATLRYHTADTMSHGLCAALLSAALWLALSALAPATAAAQSSTRWPGARGARWLGAGLCLGLLLATRPVTGGVLLVLLGSLLARGGAHSPQAASHGSSAAPGRAVSALALLLGSMPGVVLLVWHQSATTGSFAGATQLAYYALADGPPGCFGYGFGPRGCMYEHGDFVRAQMPHGYGLWQALGTSARRLKAHLLDAGNLELFCLALPIIAWRGRKRWAVRWLGAGLLLQLAAYAPFYFDGNYPGGGARLLVDTLPLEFALLGFGAAAWSWRWLIPGLSLLGFALHASYEHRDLSNREGGAPMFQDRAFGAPLQAPGSDLQVSFAEHVAQLREAKGSPAVPGAVVFVDTDHGFSLGHSPRVFQRLQSAGAASAGASGAPPLMDNLLVARRTYDSREALLLAALGQPPGFNYVWDPRGKARGTWSDFPTPPLSQTIRLEAEYDWPPTEVSGGWAHPDWPPGACVGLRRGLRLRATPSDGMVRVRLELVAPTPGRYAVVTHWARMEGATPSALVPGRVELTTPAASQDATLRHVLDLAPGRCLELAGPTVDLAAASAPGRLPTAWLQVAVTQEDFVLDWVQLKAL